MNVVSYRPSGLAALSSLATFYLAAKTGKPEDGSVPMKPPGEPFCVMLTHPPPHSPEPHSERIERYVDDAK